MNLNFFKSNIIMTLTLMESVEGEDGKPTFKVIDTINEKISRKEFINSINEDKTHGIEHEFEVVYEKPKEFQINKIYCLADGGRVWIYLQKNEIVEEEVEEPTSDIPNES